MTAETKTCLGRRVRLAVMINEIVEGRLKRKCDDFVTRLRERESAICALASAHHPAREVCVVVDQRRGSFNYCFFVRFERSGARWVVRVPIRPRLAFAKEKLEAEIATMKYLTLKTTIPIPAIHGYSLDSDNAIGQPYMVIEWKKGQTLQEVGLDGLSAAQKSHLYNQVADVLLQLRQQEFPRMGSLSLKTLEATGPPFSVEANGQEMEGLRASQIWEPAATTYTSARAYCDAVVRLAENAFMKARYAVYDRDDAEEMLFRLHGVREFIFSHWLESRLDAGPFVLAHGDFRPANLLVDPTSLDLVAVLDWEWSGVVPLQMFAPPAWLTWRELTGLCNGGSYPIYAKELEVFIHHVTCCELTPSLSDTALSLSAEWKTASRHGSVLIAAALNNINDLTTAYSFVDRRFHKHTDDLTTRINVFLRERPSRRLLIAKKVCEMHLYKIDLWFRDMVTSRPAGYMFCLTILVTLVTTVCFGSL